MYQDRMVMSAAAGAAFDEASAASRACSAGSAALSGLSGLSGLVSGSAEAWASSYRLWSTSVPRVSRWPGITAALARGGARPGRAGR